MTHDIPITFALPAVARRKFTAAFDGGQLSSDTGVLLLSNARRMTIKTTLPGGTWVEVSVSGSGTGIPEHKHDSIFDTFYTTKERGTGLGLSIARTIIETYGGKIWAENQAGGGAVFRFTLPLVQAPRSDGVPEQTLHLQAAGELKV